MQDTIIQKLRSLRLKKKWTQDDLAKAIGTSQPHISAIESGAKAPDISTVERITKVLGGKLTIK